MADAAAATMVGEEQVIDGNQGAGAAAPAAAVVSDSTWASSYEGDVKGWLDGMGVAKLPEKDALAKIIPMYRNAEQKLGVPADQLIRLPKDENDADGLRGIMAKLGLPETPDGYELPVPEGHPDAFAKAAAAKLHEIGVPKGMAQKIAAFNNEYLSSQMAAQAEQIEARDVADIDAMRAEMGDQYDKNIELSRRVRRSAGLSDDEALSIARSIGLKRATMMFAELGKSMGEHRFAGGDGGSSTFGMSIEGARARITELRKDQAFVNALTAGDADKKAEWTRLHGIAFPEQA